jgi:hypothetical protein
VLLQENLSCKSISVGSHAALKSTERVRFQVLTIASMKTTAFWVVLPCILIFLRETTWHYIPGLSLQKDFAASMEIDTFKLLILVAVGRVHHLWHKFLHQLCCWLLLTVVSCSIYTAVQVSNVYNHSISRQVFVTFIFCCEACGKPVFYV